MLSHVDHLVLATPDLAAGIAYVEERLAVEVVTGGRHTDYGTANALVSLGTTTYLEIIGPDPTRPWKELPTLFQIDLVDMPRLVTWAAKRSDLHNVTASARSSDLILGEISHGSRLRPDGSLLTWHLTDPFTDRLGGIVPFFIDWGSSSHPTETLPPRCELLAIELGHPDVEAAERGLRAVGITTHVARDAHARIVATIRTANGVIELN